MVPAFMDTEASSGKEFQLLSDLQNPDFKKIEVEVICNVELVADIQQSDSVIRIYLFFSIIVYYKILTIVSYAIQ